MSKGSSKTPLSSISRVGSLEDRWFLTNFLDVGYVLEMWGFKFWVSRMSGRSSKTPLSSISGVGFLEDSWFLTHFLDVGYFLEMSCFKFQISRMSRRPSKTPLSSISRVGSLEDWWFLTNFLDVGYVLEMVLFKSLVCSSLCGVIFMWYHSEKFIWHMRRYEKFIGHMRRYGGMKQLQSLLRSRPPESELEIEFEMTWRSSRVDLDLVWTRVWQ